MLDQGTIRCHPELRALVVEASLALARLDAERLEELALSCQALNRALPSFGEEPRADLARQARDAAGEMSVFGRVLEATRTNLDVMNRVRGRREGQMEYGAAFGAGAAGRGPWVLAEKRHGNH